MNVFKLEGTMRAEMGKKAAKAVRAEGLIPAVIYGGEATTHFMVKREDVRNLIYTPEVFIVELTLEGKKFKCIVKDLQFHPVSDKVLHMDFFEISETKPVEMQIPVVLVGHAIGVKAGGKLNLEMRRLRVKALYTELPEKLTIDVSKLALGKSIQVGDLSFEGLNIMNAKNAVVCAVKLTRAARGAAAAATADLSNEEEEEDGQEGEEA